MFEAERFKHTIVTVVMGLAGLLVLAGCASPPPADAKAAPVPAPLHGALLVVRLSSLLEPPAAVRVDVALQGQPGVTSVSGRLQQSVPGQYADYLLALALPPDRYLLTGIRDADSQTPDAQRSLATINVPFEVTTTGPVYLGRLVLARGAAAGVTVEDHFDEDTVLFRSAIGELKTATIGRSIIAAEALVGSSVSPDPNAVPPPPPGSALKVAPVTEAAADELASPARAAFAKFMLVKLPRAFAIGTAGSFGYARGANAVDRALRACAQRAGGEPCRLFAVDDTLITPDSCQATLDSGAKGARIDPGCAPGTQRRP